MKYLISLCVCCCLQLTAFASSYEVPQGDVLRIPAPTQAEGMKVQAFGKSWPIYKHDEQQVAWIAVHLHTKVGKYPITWSSSQSKQTWHDEIQVNQGDFRISHIQVKKSMSSFSPENLKRLRADQQAIKTAYKTSAPTLHTWPAMSWPVAGIISTPFAAQRYINNKPRSPHSGIDIAAAAGTKVFAPLAGKVLLVEDMYLNGNLIAIGHGNGLTSIYAHLKRSLVKKGQVLQAGEVFAEVGSTGRSTGPHLHWGVHFAGAKINPRTMLNQAAQQEAQPSLGGKDE
ncbi:MAG: M23 family metallopeptidase [Mariprofundaceae bacterium]|nr:M23 family metallopeptidase [Mariprofundaceae bacterium]